MGEAGASHPLARTLNERGGALKSPDWDEGCRDGSCVARHKHRSEAKHAGNLQNQTAQSTDITLANLEQTDMILRRMARYFVLQAQFIGLLLRYCYLRVCYLYLIICRCLLILARAALIEAVKIEYFIKSLSKEERVIFAACIAVAIYIVAFIMFIRI